MIAAWVMLLTLLFACYSTEDFSDDYNAAVCEKIYECYDEDVLVYVADRGTDGDSCKEERDQPTRADDEDCAFDRKIAKQCVEETAGMACQDYTEGTNWPESCDLVCGETDE